MTCSINVNRYVIEHISGGIYPVTNLFNGDEEVDDVALAVSFVADMGLSAGQQRWLSGPIDSPDIIRIGRVQ